MRSSVTVILLASGLHAALSIGAAAFAQSETEAAGGVPPDLPAGRYICYQGGLTRAGSLHWGYVDLDGAGSYRPFTGSGGSYAADPGSDLVTFDGGIFARYDWVGVRRVRDGGQMELRLLERDDLDAFRAGARKGGGSGLAVICGWDGTR